MLRYILFLNAFCVCFVTSFNVIIPGSKFPPTKGAIWPRPHEQALAKTYFKLNPTIFTITEKGQTCDILKSAIERYTNVLKNTYHIAESQSAKHDIPVDVTDTDDNFKGTLQELQINLNSPCESYPHLDMDENYSLNVSAVSTLSSDSIWGILRGLESFAQLFYLSDGYKNVLINTTQIVDFPKYIHRGLLIDTSRHYLSMSTILKTLDAMEMNKLNVLHWHIVDDQSFPYQSEVFPQLSQAAYDPTMIYTAENIHQIINYARDRGIRVLPEFDMPGHTSSWGVAYPSILTTCYRFGQDVGLGPMDPTKNVTFKVISDLFREVQERFPDKYFHVGGDEVELDCWSSNPMIRKFMRENNMTNTNELHSYFMSQVIPLLGERSKPIVWQEVFDEGVFLPNGTIVQVWKNTDAREMRDILAAGHKVIYSSSWYLDHIGGQGDWFKFYTVDPRGIASGFVEESKEKDILGGEACMWAEVVDDNNMISRVWPRASATAEALWSGYTYEQSVYHRRWYYPAPEPKPEILAAGHKVIYSSSWYLDHIGGQGDWFKFYTVDPRGIASGFVEESKEKDILGGEACMWAEVVDDNNMISRVWPRASATAEALWSGYTYEQSVYHRRWYYPAPEPKPEVSCRLEEHACRMNRRGIHAQPPNGPGFCITK